MKNVTNKQKRGFADSLYHLLMTSPETGRRLGFYAVGNAPNGNLRIGVGTPDGNEFWLLDVVVTESTEFEVKALKPDQPTEDLKDWASKMRAECVLKHATPGSKVQYAGAEYEVARVERGMVGIYDEPPSRHVDFINPRNLTLLGQNAEVRHGAKDADLD